MIARRHSRAEQALALALLFAPLAAIAALAGPALWQDWRAGAAEIAALEARHAELLRRRPDLAGLEALRDRLRTADPAEFGLIATATVELARVEIERQVRDIAGRHGAVVSRTGAIERDDARTASTSVSLALAPDALAPFLVDLANARPLVFVDALSIRRETRGEPAAAELAVWLALSSYTAVEGGAEPPR